MILNMWAVDVGTVIDTGNQREHLDATGPPTDDNKIHEPVVEFCSWCNLHSLARETGIAGDHKDEIVRKFVFSKIHLGSSGLDTSNFQKAGEGVP